MANVANFMMVVDGSTENIKKFFDEAKEETALFYEFYNEECNLNIEENRGVLFAGARWSVYSSTKIDYDKKTEDGDYSNSWIVKKSKEYNLSIKYRSYELGDCFTESFEVVNGEVKLDECKEIKRRRREEFYMDWIGKITIS